MILSIDTSTNSSLCLVLSEGDSELASKTVEANHAQAEKLLPLLEVLLSKTGRELSDLKKIVVADEGEGFTSLRIGIITANALAFALDIPVETPKGNAIKAKGIRIVAPRYNRPPSITKKA